MATEKVQNAKFQAKKSKKTRRNIILTGIVIALILIVGCELATKKSEQVKSENVAAMVNGNTLTIQELDERYESLPTQYKMFLTRENMLDQLISEKLLLEEAKKENIQVSNEYIEQELQELMNRSKLSKEDFIQTLAKQNITYDEFVELYRIQITISHLINKTVTSKINVSDEEIEEFYDTNKELFSAKEGQMRARHILVKTEDEAKDMLEQLAEGADFIELARVYSVDFGSAQLGGDLGFFSKGQMVKEFEDAAFALKQGELSNIVKTQFGFHIIKREGQVIEFTEAKEGIKAIVLSQRVENFTKQYVKELRDNADIQIFLGNQTIAQNKELIQPETTKTVTETDTEEQSSTFTDTGKEMCAQDNKPVIRLFSTTTCPHCRWIKTTFDSVAKELMENGQIAAYHWELDTGDNTLTEEIEDAVPELEVQTFKNANPKSTVPTFVFGCTYVRIGNAFEKEKDLNKEREEFIAVINKLV